MNHVIGFGDFSVGVGNDGVVHCGALRFIDVIDPAFVVFHTIYRQGDDFDIALGEVVFVLGHGAQLSGAHRGEVLGVGEEDPPAVAEPLMEVDGSESRPVSVKPELAIVVSCPRDPELFETIDVGARTPDPMSVDCGITRFWPNSVVTAFDKGTFLDA